MLQGVLSIWGATCIGLVGAPDETGCCGVAYESVWGPNNFVAEAASRWSCTVPAARMSKQTATML